MQLHCDTPHNRYVRDHKWIIDSVDELVNKLFQEHQISEREVKETILRLREEGKIRPNNQWKMEIA